jgi:hypothetical protein
MRLTSRTRLFRARRVARAAIHWITAPFCAAFQIALKAH